MNDPAPRVTGDALLDAYEEVAYVGRANPKSHPDRMATIATLLGMSPAPPSSCRVLEVACGDGANLVPMAASLPGSRFVGFDFAPTGIARATRMAADLGLSNVEFRTADIRAFREGDPPFDYIIAHGFYSWVPADVRALLLPFVERHLAPNGVALVSYNTYPGCHLRRALWEILRYHTRDVKDMPTKLAAARSLISLLSDPASAHRESDELLRRELQHMRSLSDSALAHDDLSEPNDPVYFHEFAADLERSRLIFLAEAELHTMVGLGITPRVRLMLGQLDRLTREQYLDFVHFRRFRQSLVCHAGALSRFVIDPACAKPMHASAAAGLLMQAREGNLIAPGDEPLLRALKRLLVSLWPRSIPLAGLARALERQTAEPVGGVLSETAIVDALMRCYGSGLAELYLHPPTVAVGDGERPAAFAPSRWQAANTTDVVANAYHDNIELNDPVLRPLLTLLDGTRTREQILADAGPAFAGPNGPAMLQRALDEFARLALLVA